MIQINQLKIKTTYTTEELWEKTAKLLRIKREDIDSIEIMKRSVDARKKTDIFYVMNLVVSCKNEAFVVKKCHRDEVKLFEEKEYHFPRTGEKKLSHPPIVVGSGPAGLFCAYELALHGYCPIVLERGEDVDKRMKQVEDFWQGKPLHKDSNVQFGEGGAGTFSDGKLNTLNKDPFFRNKEVLKIFVKMGAKDSILYDQKPHLGTDALVEIVKNLRSEIIRLGGQVRFLSKVTEILLDSSGKITGVKINDAEKLESDIVVLALGHSARDTFEMLYQKQIPMEAKEFAIGYRIMHPQSMINKSQYGVENPEKLKLGAAAYKLTASSQNGRGVYSFCMCPGGYVVNASSEEKRLVINGMSYSGRESVAANSAIIISVKQEDFGESGPLSGVHFQQKIEESAYKIGNGNIPLQLYGDFKNDRISDGFGDVIPCVKGKWEYANLRGLLPASLEESFMEAMESFGKKINGFDRADAILCGVETRTSSPLRICRDKESLQSTMEGLYPCGEGAGYAGGITSAAADGIHVAEKIASVYEPIK